jgi:hypothetical protein
VVGWRRLLPGQWTAGGGINGTAPAAGEAYAAVGANMAVVGLGLTLYSYDLRTGDPLWVQTVTGFPVGSAIVSVRVWPGAITAGVAYGAHGGPGETARQEVVVNPPDGRQVRTYPAAPFGGAVAVGSRYAVIVGASSVTSYDNISGAVRWTQPTGQHAQAWRVDGGYLYVTVAAGGYLGSQPVTALQRISLRTGAELTVRSPHGAFAGALGGALGGAVLFSAAQGVVAYDGVTGRRLWSLAGAVPEGTDPVQDRFYLTQGAALVGVDPRTGEVETRASGSAVNGSGGLYAVSDGIALGLDQGSGGDAWGYDIAAQQVVWSTPRLPWPHYFVDLSGIGGSTEPGGDTAILAICAQLAAGASAQQAQVCERPELIAISR